MDYPLKTIAQLQPILQGFRKASGLSQAAVAKKLGITQQSYAEFELNPQLASVERLMKILRLLNVEISLSHRTYPDLANQETLEVAPVVTFKKLNKRALKPITPQTSRATLEKLKKESW